MIENKQALLDEVNRKSQEIFDFVNNQKKRKLLHDVSEDYKRREGDMYDYALQMQTNSWATGLKEVKPFTQQEKYLEQRMNSLYRELSSDENIISFDKKCS